MTIFMDVLTAVGIPVGRGVYGWLQKALSDGFIDRFEWVRLGETVLRILAVSLTTYFGFSLAGVNVPLASATLLATVADMLISKMRR